MIPEAPPVVVGQLGPDRYLEIRRAETRRIQDEVGPHLYVVTRRGAPGRLVVLEGYWPHELRHPAYREPKRTLVRNPAGLDVVETMSEKLTPAQYADFRAGRLVAIVELAEVNWSGFNERLFADLRSRDRARRRSAERKAHVPSAQRQFRIGLENAMEAEQQKADDEDLEYWRGVAGEIVYAITPKVAVAANLR